MRNETDESLTIYFQDVRLLSPYMKKEKQWELVVQYLPLVIKLAKPYQHRGLDYADLIQAGNIGLLHAVKTYDTSKDVPFMSWGARCIKQAIKRSIAEQGRDIRVPEYKISLLNQFRYFRQTWLVGHEQDPPLEEVAKQLNISCEMVVELTILSGNDTLSLDFTYSFSSGNSGSAAVRPTWGPDDSYTIADSIGDEEANPEVLILREDTDQVEQLLAGLSSKERQIISLRNGLESECHTYQEIASLMGKGSAGVVATEQRALMKMRRNAHLLGLDPRNQ